jgi:hypothetical protein
MPCGDYSNSLDQAFNGQFDYYRVLGGGLDFSS